MRLFVAAPVPPAVQRTVEERVETARSRLPRARWVATEAYHFTLVFLGERSEADLPDLRLALACVFAEWHPFQVQLCAAGFFPPGRPARVLWVGVESAEELQKLQAAVARKLELTMGVESEKRVYHPHLTVARCSQPWSRKPAEAWSGAIPGSIGERFEINSGLLMQSHLGRRGARYEILDRFPFARS